MRKLRHLSIAVALTLALSASAFAGIIGTGPLLPPEPPPVAAIGITDTPPSATAVPAVEITLDLVQILFSVL